MKIKNFLIVVLLALTGIAQSQIVQTTRGCGTCADGSNQISNNGDNTFTASNAQAYFWRVCDGNVTIVGSNTSQTITLSGNVGSSFGLRLTRFVNGNCIRSCESGVLVDGNDDDDDDDGGVCEATNEVIGCADSNGPLSSQYPTNISIRLFLENPFPNNAHVNTELAVAGSGIDAAGAEKGLFPNQSSFYTEQYMIIQSSSPLGITVPLNVIYTDLVTGDVCVAPTTAIQVGECTGVITRINKSIYPNPYNIGEVLNINEISNVKNLTLLNFDGTPIEEFKLEDNQLMINKNLKSGVYFLKYTIKGEPVVKRVIIN